MMPIRVKRSKLRASLQAVGYVDTLDHMAVSSGAIYFQCSREQAELVAALARNSPLADFLFYPNRRIPYFLVPLT